MSTDKPWHQLDTQEAVSALEVEPDQGLASQHVAQRQQQYGLNQISQFKQDPRWLKLLKQFHNPLIYILLVAGTVALLLGEVIDAAVIYVVVLANAIIGYLQEAKAQDAINSLRSMLSSSAMVLRDGRKQEVAVTELVPGDVVFLSSGDKVPADMRLLSIKDLQVDESALTGESVASTKVQGSLAADCVLGDRSNMAFAGTLVTYGQGRGLVVTTGDVTETGKIASLIRSAQSLETPLTRKISYFSKWLLWVILALAAITFVVGVLRGQSLIETFMAAVALSVAAIPEGLPAVVTITLAIGVSKMAKRHAIIRKLPAVETLGSTNVICSDKTGTLTENRMQVQFLALTDQQWQWQQDQWLNDAGQPMSLDEHPQMMELVLTGVLCNDSSLVDHDGRLETQGDPTEGALLMAARSFGWQEQQQSALYPRLDIIPFESDRQYMATKHLWQQQEQVFFKGALEKILALCDRDQQGNALDKTRIESLAHRYADQGLRVLAFARWPGQDLEQVLAGKVADGCFLGLQAMMDPPRAAAITAVADCQQAGVQVKMITGDHALTARAIAKQIGIRGAMDDQGQLKALTGAELSQLTPEQFRQASVDVSVFARVAPEQKLQLVLALQEQGAVVAMTGDGVNDAPALKQADIGVAMGIAGTEVAKEAADMVLLDDHFATITAAVEEGRGVYDNLIKFIAWILPTNIGQGLVIMMAVLFGALLPVLPVQALWLNMTTAIFLGLMLAFEPKEPGIMTRQPRPASAAILDKQLIGRILLISGFLLVGAFALFAWALDQGRPITEARTLAVTLFVIVQTAYLFNCRTLTLPIWKVSFWSNPWIMVGVAGMMVSQLLFVYNPYMQLWFQSAALTLADWLLIGLYALLVSTFVECLKWLKFRAQPAKATTQ